MSGLLIIVVHVVPRLNMDCLMKSFRHSNSNYSSKMFAIQGYLKHSQVQYSLICSTIAILYSSSSYSMQNSFRDLMQQICFMPLANAVRKFSYRESQMSVIIGQHNY
jgi:TctA family transporter